MKHLQHSLFLFVTYSFIFFLNGTEAENSYDFFDHNITDIAVIGAGPAGLTAAYQAARSGYHTTLITGEVIGGQLLSARLVENLPGVVAQPGYEIVECMEKKAQKAGVYFIHDTIIEVQEKPLQNFFSLTCSNGFKLFARTIIIATGGAPRRLGIPGELEYWGKGVYTCALCDGFAVQDGYAAIVGGGNNAIEQALILAPLARTITIFVRKNRMRADFCMQDQLALYNNIHVIYNHEIIRVMGSEESITHMEVKNLENNEISLVPLNGLFLAIGHNPNTSLFSHFLPLNDEGYVQLSSRSQQTTIPGIFVAGEVADPFFRQVGLETGFGIQAALEAIDFLRHRGITHYYSKIYKNSYFREDAVH